MYNPTGFSEKIFKDRYAFTQEETWEQACLRVANQMALAELPEKQEKFRQIFNDVLVNNYFVPGGRIWYNSGRNNPQLLNCFVLDPNKDSKEGWGKSSYNMIVTSMTGGGCGDDFTDIRPRGAEIKGQKGEAPGPVELMRLIDGCSKPVRAGGQRRVALMFSLGLRHPDVEEFIDAKLVKGELTNANVSVRSDKTRDFIKAVEQDGLWELSWKGKYKKQIRARDLWEKIVTNAYNSAEPGFLNLELAEEESTISYIENLVTTNPCFAPETLVTTRTGVFEIKDLVGKKVQVFSNGKWVEIDNFRITNKNQKVYKVTLQDGSEIRATEYHNFITSDGTRKQLRNLEVGESLLISEVPTDGTLKTKGAYIKGFLLGDGTTLKNKPLLFLYSTKFNCENRLIESAKEIEVENVKKNEIEDLYFNKESRNRKTMAGLSCRKVELAPWASVYKSKLPSEIFNWDKESKLEFIAGYLDADGTASDSKNGFMYQVSSIEKKCLLDFQTLLKTLGIRSKVSLTKKSETKDFNDGYGSYTTKDCYRLTISQISAVKLAKMVKFSRLTSFADKTIINEHKPKFNKIVSITEDGVEENVYCCTVESTHSFTLANGIEVGQCGEIFLSAYDCCCLGHLVLPRFIKNDKIDWALLGNTVRTGVRFLDNVLSVNTYPLPEMKEKSHSLRRIGLGTTGLADALAMLNLKYGSKESLEFVDKLYRFISKAAYEASVMLAVEKGPFPACDPQKHIETGFVKRMSSKIKSLIAENGIRNCALLTQAPTGTVSILSGNCSSGIEPMFSPAYERRYWDGGTRKTELVFHPLFESFMKEGRSVDHFVGASELTVRDHLEIQKVIQKHVDNAVSKTINIPYDYPIEDMKAAWLDYLPFLKGTTFYRENTRGYVDENGNVQEPPLKAIPLDEAKKRFNEQHNTGSVSTDDCASGLCEI